ncbi:MAG TPA: sugar ABC transporter permease [Nonomuraea sp.]|nr:sugar ABC transporter permease [Nonomuraea sp.]
MRHPASRRGRWILLAGLQGMPTEVIEAAKCDGANRWQLTMRVVVPLMKPIIAIAVVLSVIGGLKVFDLIFIMTRGGPSYATEVFASMLYRKAFDLNEMGVASALAGYGRGRLDFVGKKPVYVLCLIGLTIPLQIACTSPSTRPDDNPVIPSGARNERSRGISAGSSVTEIPCMFVEALW